MNEIKVLIGCDGVNSVVAKWLGFKNPAFTERSAIRGFAEFEDSNGFEFKEFWFFSNGNRSAFIPCDQLGSLLQCKTIKIVKLLLSKR